VADVSWVPHNLERDEATPCGEVHEFRQSSKCDGALASISPSWISTNPAPNLIIRVLVSCVRSEPPATLLADAATTEPGGH
jgi:hypothetical protein